MKTHNFSKQTVTQIHAFVSVSTGVTKAVFTSSASDRARESESERERDVFKSKCVDLSYVVTRWEGHFHSR